MDDGLVEMVVESVRVHMLSSRHVVILKEAARDRYLPIWIGPWEASAIAMKLQGLTPERPLTHDLFATTLEALGARIDRVDHQRAGRRDVPRPDPARARRPDRRGRRATVRRARARGPDRASGSSRPTRSSSRRRSVATRGSSTTTRAARARRSRRPARTWSIRGSTSSATSSTRSTSTPRARAARARLPARGSRPIITAAPSLYRPAGSSGAGGSSGAT